MQATRSVGMEEPWPSPLAGVLIVLVLMGALVAYLVHAWDAVDAEGAKYECNQCLSSLHVKLQSDDQVENYDSSGWTDVFHHARLRLSDRSYDALRAAILSSSWRQDTAIGSFRQELPPGAERFTDGVTEHTRHVALVPSERIVFVEWW